MSDSKIETTTGMCVVALTKHLMEVYKLDYESAYRRLLSYELYTLLQDSETKLFLEPNQYLCDALDAEISGGVEQLYTFINE